MTVTSRVVRRAGSTDANLSAMVEKLLKCRVLVGVPQSTAVRPPEPGEKSSGVNNAMIGFVMEYGMPDKNIPARPFLVPGIRSIQGRITARLEKAARLVLDGDEAGAGAQMERIGLDAQAAVKQTILAGNFAPLSQRTIEARARRRNKETGNLVETATAIGARKEIARREAGETPSSEFAKPLYDTHSLFNSINYVITVNGR